MEERGKSARRKHFDYMFKMVLIGDSCVGKSCVLIRFADDNFTENHVTTIGVDFRFRSLEISGHSIKLQIWDTAGQERYKTITNSYYRGAEGVVIVFDLTNRDSFMNIKDWLTEARNGIDASTEILVFGNKADLQNQRQVSEKEIREFTANTGIEIIECSAKAGTGIEDGFVMMTKRLMESRFKGSLRDTLALDAGV